MVSQLSRNALLSVFGYGTCSTPETRLGECITRWRAIYFYWNMKCLQQRTLNIILIEHFMYALKFWNCCGLMIKWLNFWWGNSITCRHTGISFLPFCHPGVSHCWSNAEMRLCCHTASEDLCGFQSRALCLTPLGLSFSYKSFLVSFMMVFLLQVWLWHKWIMLSLK